MSQVTQLTLRSLHLMSPGLEADFAEKLQAAVTDCKQRPSLSKARKVSIHFIVEPHPEDPDDVHLTPEVTSTTPTRKLESVRLRRTRQMKLQFDVPDDEI